MGRRSSSALGLGVVAAFGLGAIPTVDGEPLQDTDCAELRETLVEVRDFLGPESSYGDLRSRLIQRALADSIQEALGAEVRRSLRFRSDQRDAEILEEQNERILQRSRGRVYSYDIVGEEIAREPTDQSRLLILQVKAQVCLPTDISLAPIVAFGSFRLPDGSADERLRTVLMSSFSQSDKFEVISGSPSQHYHDIQIEGKVLQIRTFLLDNRRDIDILRAFLGAQGTASIPERVKRIEVAVATEATFSADQNVLVKTSEVVHDLGVDIDERPAIPEMIEEAVRKSAAALSAALVDSGTGARNQGAN